MKSVLFAFLAVYALHFSNAEDDGQYHPERYGDDGRYRPSAEERYRLNSLRRNSIYSAYQQQQQPLVYTAFNPYQQAAGPVVNYGAGFDQVGFASAVSPVSVAQSQARVPTYGRSADAYARIVRLDQDLDYNGYHYLYQTDNGITAEETGRVDTGLNNGGTKARGFYEYTGNDGVQYKVEYTADENGFQPRGAHLP